MDRFGSRCTSSTSKFTHAVQETSTDWLNFFILYVRMRFLYKPSAVLNPHIWIHRGADSSRRCISRVKMTRINGVKAGRTMP